MYELLSNEYINERPSSSRNRELIAQRNSNLETFYELIDLIALNPDYFLPLIGVSQRVIRRTDIRLQNSVHNTIEDSGLHNVILIYEYISNIQTLDLANNVKKLQFKFKSRGILDDPKYILMFRDLALALINPIKVLHKHNLVHRDIKLINYFFSNKSLNKILLGDFELVVKKGTKIEEPLGTRGYASHSQVNNTTPASFSYDTHALAVCFVEIITGVYPPDIFYNSTTLHTRILINSKFQEFIRRALNEEYLNIEDFEKDLVLSLESES